MFQQQTECNSCRKNDKPARYLQAIGTLLSLAVVSCGTHAHAAETPAQLSRPIVLVAGSERVFDLSEVIEVKTAGDEAGTITILADFHPLGGHPFLNYGGPR